jgi:hypothetical protein
MNTTGEHPVATYLEEAAALLRKAQEGLIDAPEKLAAELEESGHLADAQEIRRQVDERRVEFAAAWTRMAAIDCGLLPPEMAPDRNADA